MQILLLIYATVIFATATKVLAILPKDGDSSSSQRQQLQGLESLQKIHNASSISISSSSNFYDGKTSKIHRFNPHCLVNPTLNKILCRGIRSKADLLPASSSSSNGYDDSQQGFVGLSTFHSLELVNISTTSELKLRDLYKLFPRVVHLSINHSPESLLKLISQRNERMDDDDDDNGDDDEDFSFNYSGHGQGDIDGGINQTGSLFPLGKDDLSDAQLSSNYNDGKRLYIKWESVKYLNLSWNELTSSSIDLAWLDLFPNLETLDVSHNFVSQLNISVERLPNLHSLDISGNPLDCTSDLYRLEDHNIKLLHPEQTLCDLPPHQNKAKPIWKVIRLIQKVRAECKVNCTCDIAYIWEQNHVIHSKTLVNCSARGFTEFPDPDQLPHPTDTLDLTDNHITSIKKFVEDQRYLSLLVMNLHLDNNQIDSINLLEGSEWFYNFQIFTIRNNSISEVPVYVLDNAFRQNKRILRIDLSLNKFKCECSTVTSFKIWLLRYASAIKNIEEVCCSETGEQLRYMKQEDWCTIESAESFIDALDILSIFLFIMIVLVVTKVYLDYKNFKNNGKLPWIVTKM